MGGTAGMRVEEKQVDNSQPPHVEEQSGCKDDIL